MKTIKLFMFIGTCIGLVGFAQADNIQWTQVGSTMESGIPVFNLAIDQNNNIYGSGIHNIYKILPISGSNWLQIGATPNLYPIETLAVDKYSNVYAAVENTEQEKMTSAVYEISNGGTIQQLGNDIGGGWEAHYLAIAPDGNIYTISGTDVYEKIPGNNNWIALPYTPNDDFDIKAIAVDSNNKLYAGTVEGNVYIFNNSLNQWQQIGNTLPEINCMAIDQNNNVYVGTAVTVGSGSIYKLSSGSNQWQQIGQTINQGMIHSISVSNNHLYVLTWYSLIYEMPSKGSNWRQLPNLSGNQAFTAITTAVDGTLIAGTNTGNVYYVYLL